MKIVYHCVFYSYTVTIKLRISNKSILVNQDNLYCWFIFCDFKLCSVCINMVLKEEFDFSRFGFIDPPHQLYGPVVGEKIPLIYVFKRLSFGKTSFCYSHGR